MNVYNDGTINIGTSVTTGQRLVRIGVGSNFVDIGDNTLASRSAIYFSNKLYEMFICHHCIFVV